jgi:Mn2+/Fe2+ NRAMP family transporter
MNFIGFDPIKALIYSAIFNCIVAPIVLIFIVQLSSKKEVMGEYVNSRKSKTLGWIVTVLMCVVAIITCVLLVS